MTDEERAREIVWSLFNSSTASSSAEELRWLCDAASAAFAEVRAEERERACYILDGMHCSSQVPEFKRKILALDAATGGAK